MEEIFDELLLICINEDIVCLRQACEILGVNYDKVTEYCLTDIEMSQRLVIFVNVCRHHALEKFYKGEISKIETDDLVYEADELIAIYSNLSTLPVDENLGD